MLGGMPRTAARKGAGRSAPSGHHSRKVLAVRALAAKTEWIEGRPVWVDGRLAWPDGRGGLLRPDPALLARTERALTRLAQYPAAVSQAYPAGWLAERQARWALVKPLTAREGADLRAVAGQARRGCARSLDVLAAWLPLEALGAALPVSPGAALAAAGRGGRDRLGALLEAPGPEAVQALAALALGAAEREAERPPGERRAALWPRRCREWGRTHGWPEAPELALALLRAAPSLEPAGAVWEEWERLRVIRPPSEALTGWLEGGGAPEELSAYLRAVGGLDRHLRRLRRGEEPAYDARPIEVATLRTERGQLPGVVASLAEALVAYLPPGPEGLRTAGALDLLFDYLLELAGPRLHLAETLRLVLEAGVGLRPPERAAFAELVARRRDAVWDREGVPLGRRARSLRQRAAWFRDRCEWEVRPLAKLLAATEDSEAVRAALDLGCSPGIAIWDWRPDGLLRLVVGVADQLEDGKRHLGTLRHQFEVLPPAERRAAARELVRAVRRCPEERQPHALHEALMAIGWDRSNLRRNVQPVLAALPRAIATHAEDADGCFCEELLEAAALFRREYPRSESAWFPVLLAWVVRQPGGNRDYRVYSAFTRAVQLAAAFCDGPPRRFQALFEASVAHRADVPTEDFDRGVARLARAVPLRASLAHACVTQTARCEKLAVAAGLALRLRPDVLDRLDTLAPTVADAEALAGQGWEAVLDLAPDTLLPAVAYARAQAVLGGDPGPPKGVRTALGLPDRLRREAAHLARRVAADPSPSLAARLESLRARLADGERLDRQVNEEARERLVQAAHGAVFTAAWRVVDDVFRERLEQLAGPLPPDLEMTPDLLNAALLGVNINCNRGLLRKLLRACLKGDATWRERQPANAAFLESLRGRAVDPAAWLARRERTARCAAVPGGRVRIHLETDPLHVLQMGNYFDTCLSFGQCNSYSTVANASELNKRVLYVTDTGGRVVGRKLLVINEGGELVGFRTYTSLGDAEQNRAVRAAVRRYCRRLARELGLPLGESGPFASLLTPHWYDDGCVSWTGEEAETPGKARSGGPMGNS